MLDIKTYLDLMDENTDKVSDALTDLKLAIHHQNIDRIQHYAQVLADVANDVADDAVEDVSDIWEVGA